MNEKIVINDQHDTIEIGFADIEKYHGQQFIAGAAIGFKALQAAFAVLCPDRPPQREELTIVSGHPGLGVRDAFEFVTRTVVRGGYTVDTTLPKGRWNPYRSYANSFVITLADGRQAEVVLKEGILPERFFFLGNLGVTGVISAAEQQEVVALKRALADQLVSRPASELFTVEVSN
jgi:replicative DNA helicase